MSPILAHRNGTAFSRCIYMWEKNLNLYSAENKQKISEGTSFEDISSPELDEYVGEEAATELRNDLELLEAVYPQFDRC